MPEVKIPENMHPFECDLNGKHYGPYAPGTVADVPAEVAALIRDNAKLAPVENPPETLEEEIRRIATQIAEEKVAEATTPLVVDLTGLSPEDFNNWIDVTETCGIMPQEFIDALYWRRKIEFKAIDEDRTFFLSANAVSYEERNATATSMLSSNSDGITLLAVTLKIQEEDGVKSLVVFASIGFAPNPYAGGGE